MNNMDIFNELIKYQPGLLEKPIEELVPISFIGGAVIQAYRAIVSKLPNLPMIEEQKKKTLADGQDAGKMLLAIEARIGELLPDPNKALSTSLSGGGKAKRPEGIKSKQAFHARTIAGHPTEVAEVIQEAEENEDIPTKTAVLNKVRFKKEKERRETAEKKIKPEIIISLEEQNYLMKLEKTVYACPQINDIPKNWHEQSFHQAQGMARIIIKRLEVLLDETESITN
jgi:hypothetical protein